MFEVFSRSWAYARTSYEILWEHKRLIVFPLLASAAALLVTVSFLIPLYGSGALERWLESQDSDAAAGRPGMYVTAFAFYFCNYFVLIFFNSALIASTTMWINGREPSVRGGLAAACKRLPQIFGWALVSAVIGVLLRIVENAHKKAGKVIAAVLGTAWTALTYFVVPVIVIDGVGPVEAVKRSVKTLRSTWGTALVGNFSLGLLGLIVMLPAFLLGALLIHLGFSAGLNAGGILLILAGMAAIATGAAAVSAADTVFKALLFAYSTERTVPAGIDTSQFADAFVGSAEA